MPHLKGVAEEVVAKIYEMVLPTIGGGDVCQVEQHHVPGPGTEQFERNIQPAAMPGRMKSLRWRRNRTASAGRQ
jgi:hypothetical protein